MDQAACTAELAHMGSHLLLIIESSLLGTVALSLGLIVRILATDV
jgi:hypothetical protein